jgi:hypothetical protein
MQARRAIGLRTLDADGLGKLMKPPARKIRMPGCDRSVDEPDPYLRAATRSFHQWVEF